MPSPWGRLPPQFPRPKIKNVADRCLTLRQLRDLQHLLQRLCKAGLLRYPNTHPYDELGCAGQRIKWTKTNQYDISSGVIKRVIPKEASCSWVELVANGQKQPRRFFCSHFWGEAFRDFVATIEGQAREHRVQPHEAYFICVYVNNQHEVELGEHLSDSPFYLALRGAESTVVMLDKKALALQRIWCVYEIHETMVTLKQPLQVWTPMGRVGSALVSSGPAMTALQFLDTATAEASNCGDKRRILNHIAGLDETLNADKEEEGIKRVIVTKRASFDNLNDCIRSNVFKAVQETDRASPPEQSQIKNMQLRGVTLAQIRAFAQEVKGHLSSNIDSEDKGNATWDSVDFYYVVNHFVKPKTEEKQCSYAELINSKPKPPEFTVCFWWGSSFQDFMQALEWHSEARQLSDTTSYWIGPLAFNHWEAIKPTAVAAKSVEETVLFQMVKKDTVGASGVLVVLEKNAVVASRLWSMLEACLGIRYGKTIDLATRSGSLATTRPFADGSWEFGEFDEGIADILLDFDVCECRTLSESDRCMILNFIAGKRDALDDAPPRACAGYDEFNWRFRAKAAGPVLRLAAFNGDLETINLVIHACPELVLSAQSLRGTLGETALHIAAAGQSEMTGDDTHLAVIDRLVELQCDPNSQDLHGEAPLHYAALSGQAFIAARLLEMRANPALESFSAETPLQVAQQNPAYFLGVDTSAVIQVLESNDAKRNELQQERSPQMTIATSGLALKRSEKHQQLKAEHWDNFGAEEAKVEAIMAKLVASKQEDEEEEEDDEDDDQVSDSELRNATNQAKRTSVSAESYGDRNKIEESASLSGDPSSDEEQAVGACEGSFSDRDEAPPRRSSFSARRGSPVADARASNAAEESANLSGDSSSDEDQAAGACEGSFSDEDRAPPPRSSFSARRGSPVADARASNAAEEKVAGSCQRRAEAHAQSSMAPRQKPAKSRAKSQAKATATECAAARVASLAAEGEEGRMAASPVAAAAARPALAPPPLAAKSAKGEGAAPAAQGKGAPATKGKGKGPPLQKKTKEESLPSNDDDVEPCASATKGKGKGTKGKGAPATKGKGKGKGAKGKGDGQPSEPDGQRPPLVSGWLNKRGPMVGFRWVRLWCVLESTGITYFEDEACRKKKGEIEIVIHTRAVPFRDAVDDDARECAKHCPFGFLIDDGVHSRFFDAGSESILNQWIDGIGMATQNIQAEELLLHVKCLRDHHLKKEIAFKDDCDVCGRHFCSPMVSPETIYICRACDWPYWGMCQDCFDIKAKDFFGEKVPDCSQPRKESSISSGNLELSGMNIFGRCVNDGCQASQQLVCYHVSRFQSFDIVVGESRCPKCGEEFDPERLEFVMCEWRVRKFRKIIDGKRQPIHSKPGRWNNASERFDYFDDENTKREFISLEIETQ